jgi:hypothetical protein
MERALRPWRDFGGVVMGDTDATFEAMVFLVDMMAPPDGDVMHSIVRAVGPSVREPTSHNVAEPFASGRRGDDRGGVARPYRIRHATPG